DLAVGPPSLNYIPP
nr:Chain C, Inactive serine/threonine-protein kinase TEX14 [Homo sapiens]3WUT_F Chain F, Inactive serine/threonine-protein kinase TEX14 [Homo sapiens]3WUT_I Chain I, Inactive serine/threonine-protein kinase TEX14 [Homo sapiens]3WUT_L Chain L, Inactive serine/threonine-protein kinase TEX14 [Homo sapiens]